MSPHVPDLFETVDLAGHPLRNRFVRSATRDGYADARGYVTGELVEIYRNLARGGTGLIISGITAIVAHEPRVHGMAALYDDSFIDGHRLLTGAVHAEGGKIVAQLGYRGSQAVNQPPGPVWGPSALPHPATGVVPAQMSQNDIASFVLAFAVAAERARAAGYDGVQIHAAHGFILSQFLSPETNHRGDQYGGSIENRARIIREVYQAIRQRTGDHFLVLAKINAQDFTEGGLTEDDSAEVCRALDKLGISAIEISGGVAAAGPGRGALRPVGSPSEEAYFSRTAARIAGDIAAPVIVVGGLRSLEVITKLFEATPALLFSLCRPLIAEPGLVRRWKAGDRRPSICRSCSGCLRDRVRCVLTP